MEGSAAPRFRARDVVAGVLVLLLLSSLALLSVPFFFPRHHTHEPFHCRHHLKQLGVYMALYESKHSAFPEGFADLWQPDLATDPNLFRCTERSPKQLRVGDKMTWPAVEAISDYEYRRPPDKMPEDAAEKYLVAWERVSHKDGKRAVLFLNGRVELMDDAVFHAAVAEK